MNFFAGQGFRFWQLSDRYLTLPVSYYSLVNINKLNLFLKILAESACFSDYFSLSKRCVALEHNKLVVLCKDEAQALLVWQETRAYYFFFILFLNRKS